MDGVGDCEFCAHGPTNDAFEDARVRTMPGPYGGVAYMWLYSGTGIGEA